ncbi:MAG TPA: hypothetical protein PLD88_05030, partial [Candidatus Berkiella sp.]|nr:hypothetical protein [Candidatus Berkiella sp.]
PYFAGLIATLMFHSGGHTLREFTAPFSLPEVINDYKKHFNIDTSSFSLSNLFYRNNKKSFMAALNDTIAYNKVIMNSAKVRQQVLIFNKSDLKSSLLERKFRVEKKAVTKHDKKELK